MKIAPQYFADPQPLTDNGFEPAASRVTVIVSNSDPFLVNGQCMSGFVAGPQTEPLKIDYPLSAACFEWSFCIGDAERVLGLAPKELCNKIIAIADLSNLDNAKRALDGNSMFVHPNEAPIRCLAHFAWNELQREGGITMRTLSVRAGYSLRRIEQVFQHTFGLSPKQAQSLFRYERACEYIQGGDSNLADIALRAGYSDQSHMTRDFRRFAAMTPATMRTALLRAN